MHDHSYVISLTLEDIPEDLKEKRDMLIPWLRGLARRQHPEKGKLFLNISEPIFLNPLSCFLFYL